MTNGPSAVTYSESAVTAPAPGSDEPERSSGLGGLASCLALLLLGFWVHRGALENEFVAWDDDINLYENPNLIHEEIRFALPWVSPYQGMWIPVTYTTWAAVAAATREQRAIDRYALDPAPYHALNLLLHLASSMLVFALLRRWLPPGAQRRRTLAALCGALLFCLHPIQVEVVHWATAMKGALSVFFALVALVLVPVAPGRFEVRSVLAWIAFALALAAKPAVIVVPIVWLLATLARDGRPTRAGWVHLLGLTVLAAGAAIVARVAQPAGPSEDLPTLVERLWITLDSLGFYLEQLVAWRGYCPDYGRTPEWVLEQGFPSTTTLIGCAYVALGLLFLALGRWRIFLAWLVFPAVLGPVLGLLPFSHQKISTVTDRYAYLALLAPAFAMAWTVTRPRSGPRFLPLWISLLALFGWQASTTGASWRNTQTMWEHVLEVNPNSSSAWTNLGYQHEMVGRNKEALEHYERAAETSRGGALALNNIGNIHFREQRFDEAFAAYERALDVAPRDLNARNNIGAVHQQRGQLALAIEQFEAVLAINPRFAPAHRNLGTATLATGDLERAESCFRAALAIDPGFAQARRGLATTLVLDGDRNDEARSELARALASAAEGPEFELAWASLLARAGRPLNEVRAVRLAVYESGWREPQFVIELGHGLLSTGDFDAAEEVLRTAIELAPKALDARLDLAKVLEQQGRWDEYAESMATATKDFPQHPAPWHNLAVYHLRHGRRDMARAMVDEALRRRADFGPSQALARELR